MRRDFQLPAEDREALDACCLPWETVLSAGQHRLVIHDYPLPAGYSVPTVSINLWITPGYPDAALDMVYVFPPVSLTTGRAIGALATDVFEGRAWQRWSRHRTGSNPWRPGLDNVATHLALVDAWFAREITPIL